MTDLNITAVVTRTGLSLADLNINDHVSYRLGDLVPRQTVTWDRHTISSPYIEGDVTISRRRPNVVEQVQVWVLGSDQASLRTNIATLIAAFTQDIYTLSISIGSTMYAWSCEAADYQVGFEKVYMNSGQVGVTFSVPRQPVPLAGAF